MTIFWIILIPLVILIAVVAGIFKWVVGGQNNLVHAEELCANSLSQIGVQQASRWDSLTALADLTKTYSDQEYSTLMDVIHARQGINNKSTASEVDAQEQMLSKGLNQIMALAEAYPDLKANTLYLKTMDEVKHYEDNVRMSRMVYNDTVTKYNRLVRSLPGSLLAGSLGFAPREYLSEDKTKAEMPTLSR